MDYSLGFSKLSQIQSYDSFQSQIEQFEQDIQLLLRGPLHAARTHLAAKLEVDVAEIKDKIEKANGGTAEWLGDDLRARYHYFAEQERFLRNMAVVALASKLTHCLREMAKGAETFVPRPRKRYGQKSDGEFNQLWTEFSERFGLDFKTNAEMIAFVDPMREVRNQIVHDGGEANPIKWGLEVNETLSMDDMLDKKFSLKYPEFVEGEGWGAAVRVTEEQLHSMIEKSVALLKWIGMELRLRELGEAIKEDEEYPGRMKWGEPDEIEPIGE